MRARAYYNENDPYVVAWLRNLIAAGHIADGVVDDRSIVDVRAEDLRGFTQCHFFAGIGVWSRSLRLAGWDDERPIWTGSCPCQPFSVAGSGRGVADERHLWPCWFRLVRECRPPVVVGEQVASAAALSWLDLVSTDLEGAGYAVGAADLCAASCGAPHIRQRLYWVAHVLQKGRGQGWITPGPAEQRNGSDLTGCGETGGLADANGAGLERADAPQSEGRRRGFVVAGAVGANGVADADGGKSGDGNLQRGGRLVQLAQDPLAGFWAGADWIHCIDGKARSVEPGTFPLVAGAPARVGRLRAYGNAICAPVAEEFMRVVMEVVP